MHNHSRVGLAALCALTAAGACSGRADEVVLVNGAGTGGSSAATGGSSAATGGSSAATGGSTGGSSQVCEGPGLGIPYVQVGGQPRFIGERFENTQCYLSELPQGEAQCLPANDSTLVERLQDYINSIGYVVEFVIDVAETVPLPASCEPLIECCSQLPEMYRQQWCYDGLDGQSMTFVDGCPASPPNFKEFFGCSDTSNAANRDAGGDATSQSNDAGGDSGIIESGDAGAVRFRSLCCYRTCGYTHSN